MTEKYKCSKCIVKDSITKKKKPKTLKPHELFYQKNKKTKLKTNTTKK
tara:strand:- start:1845 stop:1988 length:144 start_codon:yes stop_codon:yes gene_type:complete